MTEQFPIHSRAMNDAELQAVEAWLAEEAPEWSAQHTTVHVHYRFTDGGSEQDGRVTLQAMKRDEQGEGQYDVVGRPIYDYHTFVPKRPFPLERVRLTESGQTSFDRTVLSFDGEESSLQLTFRAHLVFSSDEPLQVAAFQQIEEFFTAHLKAHIRLKGSEAKLAQVV